MHTLLKTLILFAAAVAPSIAFAGSSCSGEGLERVICTFGSLVGGITPIIVALALLAFFWGLAMYLLNFQGEDKDKKKGRDIMIYGILVLFVMVSVWGIVQVLQNTFFSGAIDNTQGGIPCVEYEGSLPCR